MQVNFTVTVAAGTPINLATMTSAAPKLADVKFALQVFIQMVHGGTGLGFVMDGVALNRVPVSTNSSDLAMELQPATATAPGGSYTKNAQNNDRNGIDLTKMWIDGAVNGDKIIVSYDLKD